MSISLRRRRRRGRRPLAVATTAIAAAAALAPAPAAEATWSIVITDARTREVAVGTVTCLTGLDLLAIVPVVVVGEGAAACQAAGDFNGVRRPIIAAGLEQDRAPAAILLSLSGVAGHAARQYGIVDTEGDAITFTGDSTLAWAGGVVGGDGDLTWAIQGNILVGPCVVDEIEAAMLATGGDMAERLMAGMEAARDAGGDGRCSCPGDPTGCGCPPASFEASGRIGGMIVARVGDADDPACTAGGCADGDSFMRLNVAFQGSGAPDPVDQLREQFDDWRAANADRIDALVTEVSGPAGLPANGASLVRLRVTPRTASGATPAVPATDLLVEHAEDSAGLAAIGEPVAEADGTWTVDLLAGDAPGLDRLRLVLDDGERTYELMPRTELRHRRPGDADGSGAIDLDDLLATLAAWGPCPGPETGCPADASGDGQVGLDDLLTVLSSFD